MQSLIFTWLAAALVSNTPAPMTVDSFFEVNWLQEAQLSPNGEQAALTIAKHNEEANKSEKRLYIVDLKSQQIYPITENSDATMPAWSPDGKTLYYIDTVPGQDEPQLWAYNSDATSDTNRPLTNFCGGVSSPLVSPSGRYIALYSDLFPACGSDLTCQCEKLTAKAKSKSSGHLYDSLLFRHWNHWRDERRSHLLLLDTVTGNLTDLTPGGYDVPPIDLGGVEDVAFMPDESRLAYVSNHDQVVAQSTNNDIFSVNLDGSGLEQLTTGKGNDNSPKFSADGQFMAYLSMARAGFEADLPRLMLYNQKTKETRQLATELDRPIIQYQWATDNKGIYFIAMHHGRQPLYYVSLESGKAELVNESMTFSTLSMAKDGTLALLGQNIASPAELFVLDKSGKEIIYQTTINKEWKKKVILPAAQELWFKGAKGEPVQIYYLPPVQPVDPQKVPLVVLVHGGPQGVFGDDFHPRWNAQMYAARGFGVAMINFHGSVGYGQKFTDSISGNWGSYPYEDIIKGLDAVLAAHKELNGEKVCASGGSYGGYMMNWIAGHSKRFSCLISHAGVYNLVSKYGSTEELWFPEWEFRGNPYDNPKLYKKWSPINYAKNFSTPTLVIHGSNDFRVPLEQGLQMFTALQTRHVPSQLLIFTDEDHFVRKPQNIRLWWNNIHNWLETYLKSLPQ